MTVPPIPTLASSVGDVAAPLLHRGKVRDVYDLGERVLLVASDRVSAHDVMLQPPIPGKGRVLTRLSESWFARTAHLQPNHFVHADVRRLVAEGVLDAALAPLYDGRVTVARKARRIDVECVVRGHLAGGGWRQYARDGTVNELTLPTGLRRNARLAAPIFTPALKNDVGHDEDVSYETLEARLGRERAAALRDASLRLFAFARDACAARGVVLADAKLEFGTVGDRLVLIDEAFTPDAARFWDEADVAPDHDVDSMDKEPIRRYLATAASRDGVMPTTLPDEVVRATSERYLRILHRLTDPRP